MTTRLARGSMPWPLAAGAKLRVTAWVRLTPDGTPWLAIELTLYPKGWRATAHKQSSR